ncbi:hypothetical protein DPMN_072430 [Dreissena polymorpha]|uniref:Uncharacterized protein n=1 Tax=Dreissena polymorpha TaxID=45954 RepID=A0A9D3Z987_DREPO|nr:hypothetical protein DPMN_072430 [Dreissena polymorpha]
MRGPSGQTSLPSFVALGHLHREIIATSGSYYGVTGEYVPVSVTFGDTFTGSGDTETPHCTFGMRGPSGQTSLPSFVALGHLHREIIATSGSYYGVTGRNTCQLAYLRRHFHRKR